MKTKDGIEIAVGMEIWVNPECVFEDVIEAHAFTDKHVVAKIYENVVIAHPAHSSAITCDFLFENIFADRSKWYEDRQERMEEVILAKRETMMCKIAKLKQELQRIEDIRDGWLE